MNNVNSDTSTPIQPPKKHSHTAPLTISRKETSPKEIRLELPSKDYAELSRRAAQEGVSAEVLVARAVGKLLQ